MQLIDEHKPRKIKVDEQNERGINVDSIDVLQQVSREECDLFTATLM